MEECIISTSHFANIHIFEKSNSILDFNLSLSVKTALDFTP